MLASAILAIVGQLLNGTVMMMRHHYDTINQALEGIKGQDEATDREVENVKAQIQTLADDADTAMSAYERLRHVQQSSGDSLGD
jgi:hypothetical protein